MITLTQVQQALPAHLRSNVSQSLVDRINQIAEDPIEAKAFRDNFVSYTQVLREGKFKIGDYLNAVMYVSYKLMGLTNQDAYIKTFPETYQRLLDEGKAHHLSAYVAMYNKGKLVNLIWEQTQVPTWVLNQDVYQQAINTQADLMLNAKSEIVRTQAANSILTHLAKPKEAAGPLVNINMTETSGMAELKNMLVELAREQQGAIKTGVPTEVIAAQKLTTGKDDDDS